MPFAERHSLSPYLPPRPVGYAPVAGGRGPSAWHCLSCGKRNLSASRFCGGCAAPSRIPAEFLESLEAQSLSGAKPQAAAPDMPAPVEPVAERPVTVISSVATFTTISVVQQIDSPEPQQIERIEEPSEPPVVREEPIRVAPVIRLEEPVPEPSVQKPAKPILALHAHHMRNMAGSVLHLARTSLGALLGLIASGFLRHVATRRNLAIGVTSLVILCGLWPLPSLKAAKTWNVPSPESGKPVFWADMQTYISKHLGLSVADTELLARAAWGDVPSVNLPMTCERALAIETIINQRDNKPLVVFPNIPFRGPLLERHLQMPTREPAPFSDVPLDHPLYDAWRSLLAMTPPPPVALLDGKACPYESIRWEEWQPLVAAIWRSCRPGRIPPEELLVESSGSISGDDADHSIRVLGEGLGVDIGETTFRANPQAAPSRMEAFAALSRLLSAAQLSGGDGA